MLEAVLAGTTDPDIEGVEVVRRPALTCSPTDALEADGYLIGSPANLGYLSGAVKHAFDQLYYPCLDATRGDRSGSGCTATRAPKGPSARWTASPPGWVGDGQRRR